MLPSVCRLLLTALAAHNSPELCTASILAAGSNKAVELLDVHEGRTALTIPAAHSRPVHCLALGAATPPADGNVFLSAATDGALKLWDLRQPGTAAGQCVQLWSAQPNLQQLPLDRLRALVSSMTLPENPESS